LVKTRKPWTIPTIYSRTENYLLSFEDWNAEVFEGHIVRGNFVPTNKPIIWHSLHRLEQTGELEVVQSHIAKNIFLYRLNPGKLDE
jgi:hypothetical protein